MLLYLIDEVQTPDLRLGVIGHQWYWSYFYPDFSEVAFDSYLSAGSNLSSRLLDVDARTVLPTNCISRVLVGSEDVLHS